MKLQCSSHGGLDVKSWTNDNNSGDSDDDDTSMECTPEGDTVDNRAAADDVKEGSVSLSKIALCIEYVMKVQRHH